MYFKIETRLPSLNEYIDANRRNRQIGARMKREVEDVIGYYIMAARRRGTIRPIDEPVSIHIEWHEKTKRRDVDNIQSSQKFILDALQKSGIIANDNRKHVQQVYHKIIDDTEDFVEVRVSTAPESDEMVPIPLLKKV